MRNRSKELICRLGIESGTSQTRIANHYNNMFGFLKQLCNIQLVTTGIKQHFVSYEAACSISGMKMKIKKIAICRLIPIYVKKKKTNSKTPHRYNPP
jgi:hypothetical protein